MRGADSEELLSIDVVARRLGLRASAIRYYEDRGLVQPAAWRSGRRWYGRAEMRRLAIIHFWQTSALMSLDDIGDIMAGPHAIRGWSRIVEDQLAALRRQAEHLHKACEVLEHIHGHHPRSAPDGCPDYEELIRDFADVRQS